MLGHDVYYNEYDPYMAQWLRNLVDARLVARGVVDERSIKEVKADDLKQYVQCHFFAGLGGWSLALRTAGWDDDRPVWTGSCPCQPFSLAGKQAGFSDDRHLWPEFKRLIGERLPPAVFGEQVASAAAWLGLVRSDLEAMEYAVGAMPIQAASAGADHLRDRFWFVADSARELHDWRRTDGAQRRSEYTDRRCVVDASGLGRREGWPEPELQCGRTAAAGASISLGVGQADTDNARSQGRTAERECSGEWLAGPDGLADALRSERRPHAEGRNDYHWHDTGRQEATGGLAICGADDTSDVGITDGARRNEGRTAAEAARYRNPALATCERFEWVIGADGKARRVKSGIRLLVNGVSGRVVVRRPNQQGGAEAQEEHWYNRIGALRGFGNAIDHRPSAEFIRAYMECAP